MSGQTIEKPKIGGPGSGTGDGWKVIVLNDNHNTFDSVAYALATYIPGMSIEKGYQMADKIHNAGSAVVWIGVKEIAELYWEQLKGEGLTMAPLEQ